MRALLLVPLVGCGTLFGLDKVDPIEEPIIPCAFRDVSTGREFSCAVDGEARVWCWGLNDAGQVDPSSGDRNVLAPRRLTALEGTVEQIVSGRAFSCARMSDGAVFCWGANDAGQLGTGTTTPQGGITQVTVGTATDIGAGADFACAIRAPDGEVACWGSNKHLSLGLADDNLRASPPTVIPMASAAVKLGLGHRHSCVIDDLGRVWCWGRGPSGQTGGNADNAQPRLMPNLAPAIDIAAGGRTSCAVQTDHSLRCWGRGDTGELGTGSAPSAMPMVGSPVLADGESVHVGSYGACAGRTLGAVSCWGISDPGDGTAQLSLMHRPGGAIATKLSHRFYHSCAIVGDHVECWGANEEGQLGRGVRGSTPTPTTVPGLGGITKLSAGNFKACALAGSVLRCWGRNDHGELGDGTYVTAFDPIVVNPLLTPIDVASGVSRTCAWSTSEIRCWGRHLSGDVGGGGAKTRAIRTPTVVATALPSLNAVAIGAYHGCYATAQGVRCWGLNREGQLGNGTLVDSTTPVSVTTLTGTTLVAAGLDHSCGVDSGGLKCWGGNAYGQLGNGTTTRQLVPVALNLGSPVSQLVAGYNHTCALLANNSLYCWGRNDVGQVGLGTPAGTQLLPAVVTLPAPPVAIEAHGDGTCAILNTEQVYCWGAGERDQLGNGDATHARSPVEIAGLMGAKGVSRSLSGGCAIMSDLTVKCWGHTLMMGDGDNAQSVPAPVAGLSCR